MNKYTTNDNPISLFPDFTAEELTTLSSYGTSKAYKKGDVLINEGENSDFIYVLLSGSVKVFSSDQDGKEVVINIQEAGEIVGELALIDELPRSASVRALEAVSVSFISKSKFQTFLQDNPEQGVRLIGCLANRVRELTEVMRNIALKNVYGRIVYTLNKFSQENPDGQQMVKLRLTHQDIANMVGSSREMVSRILKDLTIGGYIDQQNHHIIFLKKLPSDW